MMSYAAVETTTAVAIVILELDECLALGGIVGLLPEGLELTYDAVVLGRQLLQEPQCLLLVLLLSAHRAIDEE